jgi:hypothetical protein
MALPSAWIVGDEGEHHKYLLHAIFLLGWEDHETFCRLMAMCPAVLAGRTRQL